MKSVETYYQAGPSTRSRSSRCEKSEMSHSKTNTGSLTFPKLEVEEVKHSARHYRHNADTFSALPTSYQQSNYVGPVGLVVESNTSKANGLNNAVFGIQDDHLTPEVARANSLEEVRSGRNTETSLKLQTPGESVELTHESSMSLRVKTSNIDLQIGDKQSPTSLTEATTKQKPALDGNQNTNIRNDSENLKTVDKELKENKSDKLDSSNIELFDMHTAALSHDTTTTFTVL